MRRFKTTITVIALAFVAAGCGKSDGLLQTKGRVLKGGEEFVPDEGQYIQITFAPIATDPKKPAGDYYYAHVDQEAGTFVPAGKNGKGMPPGKYRIEVLLMKDKKDLLGGKFDAEKSPFVFDVDEDTDEIVIDLDRPPTS